MSQEENSSDVSQSLPGATPDSRVGEHGAGVSDSNAKQPSPPTPLTWTGCRYSMKAYRFRAICLFLVSAAVAAAAFYAVRFRGQSENASWIYGGSAILLLVLWVPLLAKMLYRHYTISYKLDRDRLLLTRGFFRQTTDTILIPQIDDISKVQTLADRLINHVGTIEIYANDRSDGHFLMEAIDQPQKAFESIDLLRKDYIRRRGIKPFVSLDHVADAGDVGTLYE